MRSQALPLKSCLAVGSVCWALWTAGAAQAAGPATSTAAGPQREVTNSIGMKLVFIPAGEFQMGEAPAELARLKKQSENVAAKRADADSKRRAVTPEELAEQHQLLESLGPQHRVVITRPYHLGMHEVTQQQFLTIMGFNPSFYSAKGRARGRVEGMDTSRFPVDGVTWHDAAEFCRQLSALPDEAAAGRSYRLPTEAEWEYACRAGTTTTYHWGDSLGREMSLLHEHAWFGDDTEGHPHPVGEKKPNAWGLYDMAGSVFEWCSDWFDAKAYSGSAFTDPKGPAEGFERVVRGGDLYSGFFPRLTFRPAWRDNRPPNQMGGRRGFRVVCEIRPTAAVAAAPAIPAGKAAAEAKLKSKGLVRSGLHFVTPDENQFVRYTAMLERMRAACFIAQNEIEDADRQLASAKGAKAGAINARIAARTYTSYSTSWREHWNGVRARRNATDAMLLADLTAADIETWKGDCQGDFQNAVARFGEQCAKLRELQKKLQADYAAFAKDYSVVQSLDEVGLPGKKYQLGPSPSAIAAFRKLDTEEATYRQLKGK